MEKINKKKLNHMIHGKEALKIYKIKILMKVMLKILGFKKVKENPLIMKNFLIIKLVKCI